MKPGRSSICTLGMLRDGGDHWRRSLPRGAVFIISRIHDAHDAAWCTRILTAMAVADQPVGRAEAEALFEINAAAANALTMDSSTTCSRRPSCITWPLRRACQCRRAPLRFHRTC